MAARASAPRACRDPPGSGADAYAKYCALCHGDRGQGYVADNANAVAHPEFLATATDDLLRRAIARGRPGTTMSAWGKIAGGPLDDAMAGGTHMSIASPEFLITASDE